MKKKLNTESVNLFEAAMRRYFADGLCDVRCDECGSIIEFHPVGDGLDVIAHSCLCGKYTGSLRR